MKIEYFKNRLAQIFWNGDNSLQFQNLRYLPRWMVVAIDVFLVVVSFYISFLIVENITTTFYQVLSIYQQAAFFTLVYLASFFIFSTYSGLIRHSTFVDIFKIAFACMASVMVIALVNYCYYFIYDQKVFLMPFLIINMTTTFVTLLLFRVFVKRLYSFISQGKQKIYDVLIVGVNDDSIALAEALTTSKTQGFNLAGFISFKNDHQRIKILGKPIVKYGTKFYDKIAPMKVNGLIIAGSQLSISQKNELVDKALANDLKIFNVPDITQWTDKEDVSTKIKEIQIEDLLEREAIDLDDTQISNYLEDRVVLITGGAGSIGSEIVRQVSGYNPKCVLILDQAESPLYDLELELKEKFPAISYKFILADVRRSERLERVFEANNISVVFHAAAYKHVPMIESNPREAVFVNILGTVNLANLAVSKGIDRFVMVSTDKAVNPTNVMGASKRAAEIYVQSLQQHSNGNTKFITTRFGNVLGSNGSVIPYFKKQIESGGPVTVTHQDIIRYFMTIPEACQLVLQAGTMGNGGEIFVFDMGKPVRIMDLAERMIKLSGFKPYDEIDIKIIGLRPGEKLYEELLGDNSKTLPTHHQKIMIAKDEPYGYENVTRYLKEIEIATHDFNDDAVVMKIKQMVPEFISKNSVFELLDKKVEL
ncbi:nucleoside-diphosphate sugar epimerase/dehydratase [uncultured Nonlabens sp.]|uniref:polysaccharide biosynthesis protein n=1 Tax=uncultured Nonlabens sp. TaxID=859306 RepID=UPI0026166B67|nr:nucleoside-diphosphate sugar epimerase/dehydratase [uncultured Nonlabens sp.]